MLKEVAVSTENLSNATLPSVMPTLRDIVSGNEDFALLQETLKLYDEVLAASAQ